MSGFLTDVEEFLSGGWSNDPVQPLSKMKGIYKKYYVDKLRKTGICINLWCLI